jgi:hypothetical protein
MVESSMVTNTTTVVWSESCIGCYLAGTIPASIGNLTGLTSLQLTSNVLVGSIPSSLLSLSNLVDLQVGGNQFNGTFPGAFAASSGKREPKPG